MTDETPAENTQPDLDAERAALTEEGRRLASERDDLIAAGVDPADLAIPIAPTYDGPVDYEPFQGDADDAQAYDPDHEPTAPETGQDEPDTASSDPVLDHDEQPALDDGDANPDDMAGDLTTDDADFGWILTDDGEEQP